MSAYPVLYGQAGSFGASSLAENFHRELPRDNRFVSLVRNIIPPRNALTTTSAQFVLVPTADVYLINDIKLHLGVRLVTKAYPHVKPAIGTAVGPCNNTMHSLIKDVKIAIAGTPSKYLPIGFSSTFK